MSPTVFPGSGKAENPYYQPLWWLSNFRIAGDTAKTVLKAWF